MTDAVCDAGTWRTTSPGTLNPPVVSRSKSQGTQPCPSHASQARGGSSGLTPMPSTRLSIRSSTAHDGTGFDRPTSRASPGWGTLSKQKKGWAAGCSRSASPSLLSLEARAASEQGTIGRSSTVAKATASSVSVRRVATSVPAGIVTACSWGAESQNVTGAVAAAGGWSRTPISSRNRR